MPVEFVGSHFLLLHGPALTLVQQHDYTAAGGVVMLP